MGRRAIDSSAIVDERNVAIALCLPPLPRGPYKKPVIENQSAQLSYDFHSKRSASEFIRNEQIGKWIDFGLICQSQQIFIFFYFFLLRFS